MGAEERSNRIRSVRDLKVYRKAFDGAREIYCGLVDAI